MVSEQIIIHLLNTLFTKTPTSMLMLTFVFLSLIALGWMERKTLRANLLIVEPAQAGRMIAAVGVALGLLVGLHYFISEHRFERNNAAKVIHHQSGVQQHVAMALKKVR